MDFAGSKKVFPWRSKEYRLRIQAENKYDFVMVKDDPLFLVSAKKNKESEEDESKHI